jgi:hydrogenase-4 membrane subunit HyfE
MPFSEWITNLVDILSFLMLLMGLALSLARTVQQMIPYYRMQCIALALVTLVTAFELWDDKIQSISMALFVIVPVLLAYLVEPLLAQATVPEDVPVWKRLLRSFTWSREMRAKASREAIPAWLRSRRVIHSVLWYLVIDLGLIALAYTTAYVLLNNGESGRLASVSISPNVLAASFALLMMGLSIMVGTEDLISQVIGLLMMEQGMFLAVVRAVILTLAPRIIFVRVIFVIALFLYISITLVILVLLLPELHQKSGSLDIEQQSQLKG